MNTKLLWGGLAVAIVIATLGFLKPAQVVVKQGSVSGPDNTFECTSQNGLQACKYRQPLATATTTPCAIKSPSATSTVSFTSVQITTATSTATTWTVAKDTTAFATTTPLFGNFSLGSGLKGTMNYFASSTLAGVDNLDVLAPNTYLVWGVAGTAISGTAKLNGFCSASFLVN